MAYTNLYGAYQPGYYQPPVPDQLTQLRQPYQPPIQQAQSLPQQPASNGIIWVQGKEGAKAYMVAAGNSVLLMDADSSTFYLKTTDSSGIPQPLRIFDYTERAASPKTPLQATKSNHEEFVTRSEFDALAAQLDALTAKEPTKAIKKVVKEEPEHA